MKIICSSEPHFLVGGGTKQPQVPVVYSAGDHSALKFLSKKRVMLLGCCCVKMLTKIAGWGTVRAYGNVQVSIAI